MGNRVSKSVIFIIFKAITVKEQRLDGCWHKGLFVFKVYSKGGVDKSPVIRILSNQQTNFCFTIKYKSQSKNKS